MFKPPAPVAAIRARAKMLGLIRHFFEDKAIMEVVTPNLGLRGATDPHIESMRVFQGDQQFFLQTSPEFAMKRLLAAGSGPIYQICAAFRGGESGARPNPEFTLLEWYRPDFRLDQLMDEVRELVARLCRAFDVDFSMADPMTYKLLFQDRFGINPHRATVDQLFQIACDEFGDLASVIRSDDEGRIDDILDLMFSSGIEPGIQSPQFVTGFPASQAALARADQVDADKIALRFELYWRGVELANGYDELRDPEELIHRISRDNRIRQSRDLPVMDIDERLLRAITEMPECSGVALGLDRLLMVLMDKSVLSDVMTFSVENC